MWNGGGAGGQYDRVYKSKVFDETYTKDIPDPLNTREVIKGGTGYGLDNKLPDEIENCYPDYSLYPQYAGKAYGFLTRGCFRKCKFCVNQKYNHVFAHSPLQEFFDPERKTICLLVILIGKP